MVSTFGRNMSLQISDKLKQKLKSARKVAALTGAGISAESGAPTFRDSGGLWEGYRPEDVATPEAFERDPKFVWDFYDERRNKYQSIQPNPAHKTLAHFEKLYPEFHIMTQNIDGLHQKGGSQNVIELHGNVWKARCTKEGNIVTLSETPLPELPPKCRCGAILRPHVVWFGELLPAEEFSLSERICSEADLLLVIGTSAVVYPVASLPYLTKQNGGFLLEVNTEETPLSSIADETLPGKAGEILPQLEEIIAPR